MSNFSIRTAEIDDLDQIRQLFRDTITMINVKDYHPEQIAVWAASSENVERWVEKIKEHHFFVAHQGDRIIGFCSLTDAGYLDFMYIHKDHQGEGIASALLTRLEELAKELALKRIWADVSITARPFFGSRGFRTYHIHTRMLGDVPFENAEMEKDI
jgi:putative acetyltransferase